jgi:hypothetical protein
MRYVNLGYVGYIQKGLKILNGLETKPDVAIAHLFLGEHYLNLGNTDQAASNLKAAAAMFENMEMDSWLVKTHAILNKR